MLVYLSDKWKNKIMAAQLQSWETFTYGGGNVIWRGQ